MLELWSWLLVVFLVLMALRKPWLAWRRSRVLRSWRAAPTVAEIWGIEDRRQARRRVAEAQVELQRCEHAPIEVRERETSAGPVLRGSEAAEEWDEWDDANTRMY